MPLSHRRDDTKVVAHRLHMGHFRQNRDQRYDRVDLTFLVLPLTENLNGPYPNHRICDQRVFRPYV
jgi:hypothetical protein